MNRIILRIKDFLRNPIRSKILFYKHLKNVTFNTALEEKQVIICFDGFSQHGGFVDRLKGILSFFEASKQTGFQFKIYHKFPYELKDFLEPNLHQWIATEEDMKWSLFKTCFLYSMLDFKLNPVSYLKNTKNTKIFVYNNIDYFTTIFPECTPKQIKLKWSESFKELFKKSDYLQKIIDEQDLQENRVAIHSRFTSILGDFVDTETSVLPKEEQIKLFNNLKNNINLLRKEKSTTDMYIFSDSIIYLNYMKNNTKFNILEGEPLHPDNKRGLTHNKDEHAKTFIDFFALADSKEIYLVRAPFMYPSAYPKYASFLNNIPFSEILINDTK
jgi:hypothetical protein